jgi:hypothetical protein
VINQELVVGRLLDARGDPMAVLGPQNERLQDEQVERSLEELDAILIGHSSRHATRHS